MANARITFYYAIIDETGWCYGVISTSRNNDDREDYIAIPEYNEDYVEKYYNTADCKWYLDSEFETEWIPE